MEFKGTKGKWLKIKHISSDNTHIVRKIHSEDGISICVIRTNNDVQADANFSLISKAPEMLEMLKIARDEFLDLKFDKNIPELHQIQKDIETLIKEVTELK